MQNIKNFVVHKIIGADLSSCEINVLFMIGEFQNLSGIVCGVHHKKVTEYLGISTQSYYNALASLERKRIISIRVTPLGDRDITIRGNCFLDGNFKCGYISLRNKIFRSMDFFYLKAKEKLLLLDLYILLMSKKGKWNIGVEQFYQKYAQLLKVNVSSVMRYIRTLRKTLFQYIIVDRQGDTFYFTARSNLYSKVK